MAHQTRQETTKRLPITRKGTKYVVRTLSHLDNSVPVLIAVRDMLKLARTKKEVKKMILQKLLKINGREVQDYRESIKLFNVFHAGKDYTLKLSPVRKFLLEETKDGSERLCKIIGKKLLKNKKIQFNLLDGSNIISDKDYNIEDSLYLDFSGKVKKHISPEKGSEVFIISGKYEGQHGKITDISGKKVTIKLKENSPTIEFSQVILQ